MLRLEAAMQAARRFDERPFALLGAVVSAVLLTVQLAPALSVPSLDASADVPRIPAARAAVPAQDATQPRDRGDTVGGDTATDGSGGSAAGTDDRDAATGKAASTSSGANATSATAVTAMPSGASAPPPVRTTSTSATVTVVASSPAPVTSVLPTVPLVPAPPSTTTLSTPLGSGGL